MKLFLKWRTRANSGGGGVKILVPVHPKSNLPLGPGTVDFQVRLKHFMLRVRQIYTLENAVILHCSSMTLTDHNFPYTQHRMFKCT